MKDSIDLNVISPQKKVRRASENLATAINEAKRLNTPRADVQDGESRSKKLEQLLEMPGTQKGGGASYAIDDPAAIEDLKEALYDCELYGFNEMDDNDNTVTLRQAKQSYAYRVAYDIGRAVLDLRSCDTAAPGHGRERLLNRQPGEYCEFMRKYLDKQPAVVLTRLREALGKCKELGYSAEEVEQEDRSCDSAATQVQTMVRILRAKKVAASAKERSTCWKPPATYPKTRITPS